MHFRYCDVRTTLERTAVRNNSCKIADARLDCVHNVRRFHTSMPNTSSLPREAIIMSYSDAASGFGASAVVEEWERAGLLHDVATRHMLGRD